MSEKDPRISAPRERYRKKLFVFSPPKLSSSFFLQEQVIAALNFQYWNSVIQRCIQENLSSVGFVIFGKNAKEIRDETE